MSTERGADGKFVKATERIVDASKPEQFAMGRTVAGSLEEQAQAVQKGYAQAEQFPTSKLTDKEDVDRINLLKLQLQPDPEGHPGITQFGRLDASEDNFKWLLRKKDAAKAIAFQEWFAENFDRMTPAAKEFAREIYPEFYNQRVATLEENLETARKIARLKLLGPQTKEDLALQFALDNNFIDTHYIANLINPGASLRPHPDRQARLGLLNPNRYLFNNPGTARGQDYNRTHDPTGPQRGENYSEPAKLPFWRTLTSWRRRDEPGPLDNYAVLQSLGLGGVQ